MRRDRSRGFEINSDSEMTNGGLVRRDGRMKNPSKIESNKSAAQADRVARNEITRHRRIASVVVVALLTAAAATLCFVVWEAIL